MGSRRSLESTLRVVSTFSTSSTSPPPINSVLSPTLRPTSKSQKRKIHSISMQPSSPSSPSASSASPFSSTPLSSQSNSASQLFLSTPASSKTSSSHPRPLPLESISPSSFQARPKDEISLFKIPFLNKVSNHLAVQGPGFKVNSENIIIRSEPPQFLEDLVSGILKAKSRVTISSLYLGTGDAETRIIEAIRTSCTEHPDLKVTLLFDCLRGTRGIAGKQSTLSMVLPLLQEFPTRVSLSLFHTPLLTGLLKKLLPERYNEAVGVNHIKAYIFDDDIIFSGANLSDWYFVDRQDRYMLVRSEPGLTSFFDSVVQTVCSFSYHIQPDGNLQPASWEVISSNPPASPSAATPPPSPSAASSVPGINADAFKRIAKERLEALLQPLSSTIAHDLKTAGDREGGEGDTWIFPTLQFGPAGLRHDEGITSWLLQQVHASHSDGKFYVSSAYFNFKESYANSILSASSPFDIVTAAPEANSFFASKGFSSNVPLAYVAFERDFYRAIQEKKQGNRIRLWEYVRPEWTYHGKGLWFYLRSGSASPFSSAPSTPSSPIGSMYSPSASSSPEMQVPPSPSSASNHMAPCITLIGSPNFGHRSVDRDLEAQVVILTENPKFQKLLDAERKHLFSAVQRVTDETFQRPDRQISRVMSVVTKFAQPFL